MPIFDILKDFALNENNRKSFEKRAIDALTNETRRVAARFNIKGVGHNDELDAFRHAYISGLVTLYSNRRVATKFGQRNENLGDLLNKQPLAEREMDEHNNKIGRFFGELTKNEEDLAELIVGALNAGLLVVKPGQVPKTNNPTLSPSFRRFAPVPKFKPQRSPKLELMQMEMQIKQEIQKLVRSESLRFKAQLKRSMQSATSTMIMQNRARHTNFSPFPSRGITNKSRGQIGKEMWQMLAKGLRNM